MRKLLLSIGVGLMSITSFGQNSISSNADIGSPTVLSGIGDVKCMHQVGDYLYTGLWASSNINVYDVTTPGSPVLVNTQSIESPFTTSCAFLGMDYANGYLYVVSRYTDKLYVLDVTNPLSLVVVGEVAMPVNNGDIEVDGNYAYVATIDSGGPLTIVDVSNPAAPVIVSQTPFGQGAGPYYCFEIEKSGNHCYLTYYNNGGQYELKVVDVTNPAAPSLVNASAAGVTTIYGDLEIIGNVLYLTYDNAGTKTLRTLDISTPATPVFGADIPVAGTAYSLNYDGQYLYAACQTSGTLGALTVFDVTTPLTPSILAESEVSSTLGQEDVWIVPGFAYMANDGADNLLTFPLNSTCTVVDQTITQADFSATCVADTVVTIGSELGIDYYLRDDADDSVISGPVTGTGANIDLPTGEITATTTFNVSAGLPVSSNALDLDGASYAYVSNNNPFINWNQVVVEAWVNPSVNNVLQTIAARRSNIGYEWQFDIAADGTLDAGVQPMSTGYYYAHSSTVVPTGTWSHVAMVFDGTSLKLFLNGSEVTDSNTGTTPTGNALWGSNIINTSMGATNFSFGYNYFNGQMRDVRIWKNVSKTAGDIAAGMCGVDPTSTGLELNHLYNNDLTDETPNNYTGLMNGTQAYSAISYDCSGSSCSAEMTDMLTITIDPIADQTLAQADFDFCGSKDTVVTVNNTQVGVNYYLRNDADNSVIDGPVAGTGSSIDLNAGTVATTTTFNVNATVGNTSGTALDLDGGNDYVMLGNDPAVQLSQGTYEAWIKTTNAGTSHRGIVVKQLATGIFLLNNELVVHDWTFGDYYTGIFPNDGNWHHVAVAFDMGVTNGSKVYYDGLPVLTFTYNLNSQAESIVIGQGHDTPSPSQNFTGQIDEVRIWNTVRTDAEILANYDACLVGNESNLVEYHNFEDGTGSSVLADMTSNGFDGTLMNMDPATDWVSGTSCTTCDLEMTDMLTVTINALPTVDAGTDFAVCDGTNNVTLSGSGANTYTWDNGVTDGVAFTGTVGTTTYTVTGTDLNGCENTDMIDVTVNALPTVDAGADQVECENTMITLSGAGANSYVWDNGVTDGVAFTSPNGTTTYTVTGTDLNGCENTDMVDVTINDAPVVDGGVDIQLCEGLADTTLTGSGTADTYTWDNGVTDGVQFTPPNGLTTYTVTGTITATGCTAIDMVDISVGALPTVDAGLDVEQCEGNDVTLTGSGNADTYAWNNGVTDGVAFTQAVDTIEYIVTGTITATGCTNTDTVEVIINANPTVDAGPDMVLCTGDDTTLVGMGDADTYTWDNGVTDGVQFNNPTNGVTTYTVTGTITATGCFATDQMTIDVGNNLVFQANATATDICLGDSTQLFGTGADSYSWPAGINDMDYVSPTSTITYVVTGSTNSGCMGSQNITITVNELPVVSGGADQAVCQNEEVTLSGSGADTYSWDNGITDATPFTATTVGTTTYVVTGTDMNGCMNTDTVDVNVTESPMISAVVVNENNGFDGSIDLTVTGGTGSYSYSWDHGYTDEDVFGLTTQSYTVTVNDGNCPTDSTFTIINVAGLEEDGFNFTVYPNPSNGLIQVSTPNAQSEQIIRIVDASGKTVYESIESDSIFIVDLNFVEDGTYIISIQNESGVYTKRIVKN